MQDITEVLVEDFYNEAIDPAAKKEFYDGLKNKYIDVQAFHKAYDEAIIESNLAGIFKSDGLLSNRATYGKIKDCVDPELQRALKRFWAAQYADNLHTKEEEDAATNKVNTFVKETQELLNTTKAKLCSELRAKDKDLVDEFESISGKLEDKLNFDFTYNAERNGDIRYSINLSLDGKRNGVFGKKDLVDSFDYALEKAEELLSWCIKGYKHDLMLKRVKDFLTAKGVAKAFAAIYLYDENLEEYYRYQDKDSRGNPTIQRLAFSEHKYHDRETDEDKYYTTIDYKDVDDSFNPAGLEIVAAVDNMRSGGGRCWSWDSHDVYYNPRNPKNVSKACGVSFKEYEGGNGETSVKFLDPNNIPDEAKKLGLTAGEYHHYEVDSSD